MASFKKRASNTFKLKVAVFLGDQSLGDLDVEFEQLSQDDFTDVVENESDQGLCKRVIKSVGDIAVEDSDEVLKGADAVNLVLEDACCVAACAASYMEAMKSRNFRGRGSKKGR
ncbi:MAG: hypothetical protein R3332_08310 [Pseudohongiellaceae bacterium]|nr:hypothetical protein [Pseudohongiellaceae bacterium]